MNDQFLHDLRRHPRPEFAATLHERLVQAEADRSEARGRLGPLWALAAAAAVAIALIASPTLRAYATAFLDQFRVRNFAAVAVDPVRAEQLRDGTIDLKGLLGDRVETLEEPGPPKLYRDPLAAGAAAGLSLRLPTTLPLGLKADTVYATQAGGARLTVNGAKLRAVLDGLGLTDVTLPAGLAGAQVTVRTSPAVIISYRNESRAAELVQSRSPEVSLPQGLDLAQIGEIGLRIAGLSAADAHRFASTFDWRGTVLVPVPANASTFREVTVRGQRGLLITTEGAPSGKMPNGRLLGGRRGEVLLWTEGDAVFCLAGNIASDDLMVMANSIQ